MGDFATGAVFSPDGIRFAFSASRDENTDIWLSPIEGGIVRRITDSRGIDISASWSPDGRRIAFVSDRAGDLPPNLGPVLTRLPANLTAAFLSEVPRSIPFSGHRHESDHLRGVSDQSRKPGGAISPDYSRSLWGWLHTVAGSRGSA